MIQGAMQMIVIHSSKEYVLYQQYTYMYTIHIGMYMMYVIQRAERFTVKCVRNNFNATEISTLSVKPSNT